MSVEFVTREIIFDRNSVLAWHIFDWQKINYDPAEHFVEAGEEIYLELSDEKPTVLSEKLAEEVNRQAISYSESMRDIFEQAPPELKKYEIVIAEGLMIYYHRQTVDLFNKRLFVDLDKATFLKRKSRDLRWGKEPPWYMEHIWESYLKYGIIPNMLNDVFTVDGHHSIDIYPVIKFLEQ